MRYEGTANRVAQKWRDWARRDRNFQETPLTLFHLSGGVHLFSIHLRRYSLGGRMESIPAPFAANNEACKFSPIDGIFTRVQYKRT